jgi:ketosteroid isomerase-like protein
MTQRNVAAMKDAFARFKEDGVFPTEYLDPKIELINFDTFPVTRPYHGWDGVLEWLSDVSEPFEDFRFEVVDLLAHDDERVVTTYRMSGKSRTGGPPFELVWGGVATFRNGKVLRIQGFRTTEEALEAAALSE